MDKNLIEKIRSKILERWHKISEEKRNSFIATLSSLLNYGINALLLSVPVWCISRLFISPTLSTFLLIFVSLWVLLPFLEHYYVWFKDGWKDFKKE